MPRKLRHRFYKQTFTIARILAAASAVSGLRNALHSLGRFVGPKLRSAVPEPLGLSIAGHRHNITRAEVVKYLTDLLK